MRLYRHRHRSAPTGDLTRRERGETLLELMTTVVLMGISVVGLISALFTVVSSSEQFERASKANLAAQDYAEQLRHATYKPCAVAATSYAAYAAGLGGSGLPTNFSARITKIRYANYVAADQTAYPTQPSRWGIRFNAGGDIAWSNSCPSPAPFAVGANTADFGAQEITINVATSNGTRFPASETLVFIKRDTRCLVVYNPPDPTRPC